MSTAIDGLGGLHSASLLRRVMALPIMRIRVSPHFCPEIFVIADWRPVQIETRHDVRRMGLTLLTSTVGILSAFAYPSGETVKAVKGEVKGTA